MGLAGVWVLTWDWPAHGPISRKGGCQCPIESPVWDPAPQILSAILVEHQASPIPRHRDPSCRLWAAPWHQGQLLVPLGL